MFIREAAEYVNLKVGQLRKYVAEGYIEYHHSKVENYYDYNVDDLNDLKIYLNIIENYKNFNFDIEIPDRIYSKFKEYIDHNYVLNICKVKKEYTLEEYLKHKKYFDKKRGLMVKLRCKECNSIKYIDTAIMKDIADYDNYICRDCRDEKAKQERKLIRNMKRYLNLSFRKMVRKQEQLNKKELIKVNLKDNPMEWDYYINHKTEFSKSSKKWVKIICQECHKEAVIQIRKFENRKYATGLPICSDCICKYTSGLPERIEVNRKAQLIAQNRPEVKEKMRKIISNKIRTDPEFRRKITRYSNKLSGYYKGIKFDSSWELSLLYHYGDKLKPCSITIPYIRPDGSEHLYLPDFDLYDNDKKYLVEVKGEYREMDYIKIETAKNAIKNKIIDYDDIIIYDSTNLTRLNGFKFFTSIESLNIIKDDLKILHYPSSWIKNQNLEE